MPELPEEVEVQLTHGTATWKVDGAGTCRDGRGGRQGCGESIFWCVTRKGSKAPVDVEEDEQGVHQPHFVTCRYADSHRRRR